MSIAERRERERLARREAILVAGERRLTSSGFRRLRMEDVAVEAEVSKGTLYLYFDSKDALCAAIADRKITGLIQKLRTAIGPATTGRDAVRRVLETMLQHFEDTPHGFRFMVEWAMQPTLDDRSESFAMYRARVAEVLGLLTEQLGRGRDDRSLRSDVDPTHQAVQLWASLLGLQLVRHNMTSTRKRLPHVELVPERLVAIHLDTLLRGMELT